MIRTLILIFLHIGLVLCLCLGCSGPVFHPVADEEITESDQISLMLSVSDTLFSCSAVRAYREGWNPLRWPEAFDKDSLGPQLYLWLRNAGPAVLVPMDLPRGDLDVAIAGRGPSNPMELEFTVDGKKFDREALRKQFHAPIGPPCEGYEKTLRYVKTGESVSISFPISFARRLNSEEIVPGVYELAVVLNGVCEGKSDKPLWRGKARSNRIRFHIVDK
jgi:hypothetical protein